MITRVYDAVVVTNGEKKNRRITVSNLKDDATPEDAKAAFEKNNIGKGRKIESIKEVGTVSPEEMTKVITAVNNDEKPPMPSIDHV